MSSIFSLQYAIQVLWELLVGDGFNIKIGHTNKKQIGQSGSLYSRLFQKGCGISNISSCIMNNTMQHKYIKMQSNYIWFLNVHWLCKKASYNLKCPHVASIKMLLNFIEITYEPHRCSIMAFVNILINVFNGLYRCTSLTVDVTIAFADQICIVRYQITQNCHHTWCDCSLYEETKL